VIDMRASDSAGLEWVCIGGKRVHVSDFAHLRPAERPAVTCPECGDRVTLALGKIRRHHARHREGVECIALHPETALHLNTKYYLADVLSRAAGSGATLRIRRQCLVGYRPYVTGGEATWTETTKDGCPAFDDVVLVPEWDAVRVESRIEDQAGHRVPDVVLTRNGGGWVGAIEVFVSHEVDADKAAMFARLEVPWVEVEATDALSDRTSGWTIAEPLRPRASSVPLAWRCEAHQLERSREPSRPMAVAERPEERTTARAGRVVDLYFANGTWRRVTYRVRAAYAAGGIVRLALDRDGELIEQYPAARGEAEDAFLSRMNQVIKRDCEADLAAVSRKAAIVDPGRWLKGGALTTLESPSRIRRRYRFEHVQREWVADTADATQAALESIERAMPKRRPGVQRSLRSDEDGE
jgi:hypothetical protein